MKITQKLAIVHNTSEEGLSFANEIGGFVCPSLAIVRSDHEFRNFGGITLMMDKSKVSLRTNPAHNADIFSTRFPTCFYKTNDKLLDAFSEHIVERTPELKHKHSEAEHYQKSTVRQGFDHVEKRYVRDMRVGLAFLRDQGVNPRLYRDIRKTGVSYLDSLDNNKPLLKEIKKLQAASNGEDSPEFKLMSKKVHKALFDSMTQMIYARDPDISKEDFDADLKFFTESYEERHFNFDDNGEPKLALNTSEKLRMYFLKEAKDPNPVDATRLSERIEKEMSKPSQKKRFHTWLKEHIGQAFHSPYMHVETRSGARKKLAFTAENLLKAMKGKTNGTEKTIFMGAGSIRSLVAKRFSSYREVESHMSMLTSEKEMESITRDFDERLRDFPVKLTPFYKYQTDSWHYSDAVYEEIEDYARHRSPAKLESFDNISPDVMEEINGFLDDLRVAKTHYFEIKKQSIVDIADFDVAVVPKGTDKSTIRLLKNANIKISQYDPDIKNDRVLAINKQQSLLFGEGRQISLVVDNEDHDLSP